MAKIEQQVTPIPGPPQQTVNISINLQELANNNKPENNVGNLKAFQELRNSKVISLSLNPEGPLLVPLQFNIVPLLFDILEGIGRTERIDLILQSTGGIAEVPWRIVSLIREYCDNFGVIVPEVALSGATHIAIGADDLILCELSRLGSVDPTRNHPLLPKDKNQNPIPTSVQDLKHCIGFIKEQLGITGKAKGEDKKNLSIIIAELFKHIHPFAIGAIEQSYQLSKLITRKVLKTRKARLNRTEIARVENMLGENYFSHSFPICRKDIEDDLGLPVIKPSPELKKRMLEWRLYYMKEFGKSVSITPGNQPPLQFRYMGFVDSVFTRKAICGIIAPTGQVLTLGNVII